ncbi:VOC family protein [Mycetocola reblochoni]|uniref:Bleomycin resistance protein n=2 Tax=Mycetocola reblochoni TaxID=331618 RepID=A0A1R4JBH9_9MICO|nr:VOC family protein [Mycetocola reblochoni]RLP70003.1 VOC family protein [Mycetocola reblochoni]SJN29382.1 Glyoxalase [Mycetocola reblochoni REB411]
MEWNPLVPELTVTELARSLRFYVDGVGFAVRYTREDPPFAYLDLDGAQIMLEQDHESAWVTAAPEHPRGRGLNLQIEVPDVSAARDRLLAAGHDAFRELHESRSRVGDGWESQREYLVLDPDGYLIRLVQIL